MSPNVGRVCEYTLQRPMLASWVSAAFLAGLVGAPHCLGMCGALACAAGERLGDQVPYHVGRIGTYAVLGALSGALGHLIPGPTWVGSLVAGVLLVGFSLSLAGVLPAPKVVLPGLHGVGARLAGRSGGLSRLAFGVVNGLMPCGLLYAALAIPVATEDPLAGASSMLVFGVATLPALVAATVGFRSLMSQSVWVRRLLAGGVLATGLLTIAWREGWLPAWV